MGKKTAVISGASTGMGAASAVRLAKDGFDLVLAARTVSKLEETAEACRAAGAEVLVVPTDVTKEEDVKNLFSYAIEKFGKIDFYFSNQGVLSTPKHFEDLTLDDYYLVAETNFKGTFLTLTNCLRVMKEQGYGNILITASSSAIRPESGYGVYSASKAAVLSLAKVAAIECGRFNIHINTLCPGSVVTPMTLKAQKQIQDAGGVDKVIRRPFYQLLPRDTSAEPEEIAGMVSFMASDESSYMQGAILSMDMGITL